MREREKERERERNENIPTLMKIGRIQISIYAITNI